jgi:dimethylargininase
MLTQPGPPAGAARRHWLPQISPEVRLCREIEDGTLEGGDVMMVGTHFFIGLSARPIRRRAANAEIPARHGLSGSTVSIGMLHQDRSSYLESDVLLATGQAHPQFADFRVSSPRQAPRTVSGSMIASMPSDYPRTVRRSRRQLRSRRDRHVEFRKLERESAVVTGY